MEPLALDTNPSTAARLEAEGVRITVVSAGLSAARVDLVAPKTLRPFVQAALAWRVTAMRAQLAARGGLGATAHTPVAVPGLRLPMAPEVRWRGWTESYGRTVFQERTAQRPEGGWCGSCGEPHATQGETGDCSLCNAARVAALRAEGLIGAPTPLPPAPAYPSAEEARRTVYAGTGLRAPTPVPARMPWVCEVCGFTNVGRRRDIEGCGPCTNREDTTLDMSRLGEVRRAL